MDKKSTGPYQHYERPTEKRSSQDSQPSGSARWIAVIIILAVILIALIPVVHRLASSHSSSSSATPKTYLVQSGDTLNEIAEKNGLTVDELARLNNLKDSSNIEAGQTLKLK